MSEHSKSKPDPLITMDDVAPLYCPWGIRRWFRENGVDLRAFIENGLPASQVLKIGDELAVRVVERKINGK